MGERLNAPTIASVRPARSTGLFGPRSTALGVPRVWAYAIAIRIARAPFVLAACIASTSAPAEEHARPAFHPLRFFEGRTESQGEVRIILKSPHAIRAHGQGRIGADGALTLVQDVQEEGKPPLKRIWHIRETAPGRYAGTVSDATSPLKLELVDGRFHMKFKMKGSLGIDQWLTAAPDGRSVHNKVTVRKFGITVAHIEETTRKID